MATINIKTLSETVPITSFTHTLEPLWADDTGRNANSGKFTGTFIGYFSQVEIEFGSCNQTQMNSVVSSFEHSTISMLYPSKNGSNKTETFYGTAITGKVRRWGKRYAPFSIKLTGVAKYV